MSDAVVGDVGKQRPQHRHAGQCNRLLTVLFPRQRNARPDARSSRFDVPLHTGDLPGKADTWFSL
ncbi:hypothetical protein SDC9_188340 [bioreactor metagenome]|uniref:Uncharacterized protein n=1 Tax=bioreactor metagenome TaxID=1076179 RepID=A0A645HP29_9ZZZZ